MGRANVKNEKQVMKAIKPLSVIIATFVAICLSASVALADQSCCVKAKAKGKECTHPCCVAAHKEGKTCEKCQKDPSCCDKAIAAGKDCDHPCCVEAAKAKKICEKCNPPAKKKSS
jgi:hypothetical protein